MSQFFVEFFCLGAPKNIAWNPFVLCFGMFQLAIEFMDKKGGAYQIFPAKTFFPTVRKNFVGEPSSVSLFSRNEKFYAPECYVTIIRRNHFVSQYRNFS